MAIVNTALTPKDLPLSPKGKTGWPWTEQIEALPDHLPDGSQWPRISVVTPSYNQGQFIEETIRSVLLQGYPNLEYIIIDGGSTDNSVEIIKKYEKYLAYWVSEPDKGQSHALNKGFRRATGHLVGWQNSDDYYHSKAFLYAAQALRIFSDTDVFYGNLNHVNENGSLIYSCKLEQFELKNMLPWQCIFNQSSFFKRELFQEGNFLNEAKQHIMDYDFFWRLILAGYKFKFIPEIGASYREHSNAKGSTQTDIANREFFEEYKFLYQETDLNSEIKEKILNCMHNCCLNDFWKLELVNFRKNVRELATISGLNNLRIELIFKYLISFTGSKNILFIKECMQSANK